MGTDAERIVDRAARLLSDPAAYASMVDHTNPFGDGRAGERIASILVEQLVGEPIGV